MTGRKAGLPLLLSVLAGALRDLLSFRLDSGDYPLSRDLPLGYLQDRELILRVE